MDAKSSCSCCLSGCCGVSIVLHLTACNTAVMQREAGSMQGRSRSAMSGMASTYGRSRTTLWMGAAGGETSFAAACSACRSAYQAVQHKRARGGKMLECSLAAASAKQVQLQPDEHMA